jgi:hypothetical protein
MGSCAGSSACCKTCQLRIPVLSITYTLHVFGVALAVTSGVSWRAGVHCRCGCDRSAGEVEVGEKRLKRGHSQEVNVGKAWRSTRIHCFCHTNLVDHISLEIYGHRRVTRSFTEALLKGDTFHYQGVHLQPRLSYFLSYGRVVISLPSR